MNRNKTEVAFIARGVNSDDARNLRESGWTLGKLQASDGATLRSLNLDQDFVDNLRGGGRPAVPAETLTRVLFANRWACCVCRDSARPVVVHHIEAWSKSHDHSAKNLAVLCTQHHGEAHTVRGLEMTLTANRLRNVKRQWESEAARLDAVAIQRRTQLQSDTWLYFNHLRLFELAQQNGVILDAVPGYNAAVRHEVCGEDGLVTKTAEPDSFMYVDSDRMPLYSYVKSTLYSLLDLAAVRNISDDLDRGAVTSIVVPGDLIYVQGMHMFRDVSPAPAGAQPVHGLRSANRVEVSFYFDRGEATSTSSWSEWLRGGKDVGSVVHVKQLERVDGKVRISGTVIAIRTALEELKTRMYEVGLYRAGLIGGSDDGEEDLSQFDDDADEEEVEPA